MIQEQRGPASTWWLVLLLLPFLGLLWVPMYNRIWPMLWGFPFFFWYQFLWVLLSAGITAVVYLATESQEASSSSPPASSSER